MFHNLFDSHIHTNNSPDGAHSVIYMAEQAERVGLVGVAITDYVDCKNFKSGNYQSRIVQSVVDTAKAKAAFRWQMSFSQGVEISFSEVGDYTVADKIAKLYPYDFILTSHRYSIENTAAGLCDGANDRPLDKYFSDLLNMVKWGGFDCLAYLTCPPHFEKPSDGAKIGIENYTEQIDAILRCLAENGKALEINASGFYVPNGKAIPPLRIVSRFKELGGELVTVGSDAHRIEDIGAGIKEGMELLREAGFSYFAFYRGRKPVMLRIV